MVHEYENIGIFPLEFRDGQQVESGEKFKRDFEKSVEGAEHETWLASVGLIRRIVEIPKVPAKQPKPATTVKE